MQGHPYRNVCDLRKDAASSLVQLQYETHPASEADSNPRIPDGLAFASIKAHMERLEVVFLSRFLFEILRYLQLLLALKPQLQDTGTQEQEDADGDTTAPNTQKVRRSKPSHRFPRLSDENIARM